LVTVPCLSHADMHNCLTAHFVVHMARARLHSPVLDYAVTVLA